MISYFIGSLPSPGKNISTESVHPSQASPYTVLSFFNPSSEFIFPSFSDFGFMHEVIVKAAKAIIMLLNIKCFIIFMLFYLTVSAHYAIFVHNVFANIVIINKKEMPKHRF